MFHIGRNVSFGQFITIKGAENISIADNVRFGSFNVLTANDGGKLVIGSNVSTNHNVFISASDGGEISIRDNVIIGVNAVIRASNHRYFDLDIPIRNQGHIGGRIIIEDDVWISSGAIILPNVTIGKGAIVAAGAVVTRDVESYDIVAGEKAQIINSRYSKVSEHGDYLQ
jgi:galactoside O-acetyltransferase